MKLTFLYFIIGINTNLSSFSDFQEGVNFAQQVEKPILILFNSISCPGPVKVNGWIYSDKKIKNLIQSHFVFIDLKVDDTTVLPRPYQNKYGATMRTKGNQWTELEMELFQCNSQPLAAVLTSDGKVLSKHVTGMKIISELEELLTEYSQ